MEARICGEKPRYCEVCVLSARLDELVVIADFSGTSPFSGTCDETRFDARITTLCIIEFKS